MDREYTYKVLGCVYEVYKELGPGLLESIYEAALIQELRSKGFEVRNQVEVPVYYKGELICPNLRLDLIIDNKLILELKSVVEYKKLFEKQLYTYLRLMNCEMGYVINFNTDYLRDDIYPVFNNQFKVNSTE
ncbi:MAG: GxxExxY protein [Prevotella sp.]|nr:GxxExxY protein [Prevotella sp.]